MVLDRGIGFASAVSSWRHKKQMCFLDAPKRVGVQGMEQKHLEVEAV